MTAQLQRQVRINKADLTYLAKTFEQLLEEDDYCPKQRAIYYLHKIIMTYMRGQGKRMGSYQGLDKYGLEAAILEARIVNRIMSDTSAEFWFPRATAMFPSIIDYIETQHAMLKLGEGDV